MQIKQDPITGLWAREDGAILLPPTSKYTKFKKFRWTFGWDHGGYRKIRYRGKHYAVHRIVCRAFHGLPPADKPEVDHLDRNPANNKEDNLRWADRSMNNTNKDCVDQALEKYGVRECEDKKAYNAAYRAKMQAQGLTFRKGPDGKYGRYPRIRT